MRSLISSFIGFVLLIGTARATDACVTLEWENPNAVGVVDVFNLYHSTNIALPLTNWTKVASIAAPATNGVITVPLGSHYFFMTASNVTWGLESPPSNVVSTNTPSPLLPIQIRITGLAPTNSP